MKVLDIALQDLFRSFRSGFALVMMFVAPLLITGIIYFFRLGKYWSRPCKASNW
jgi:hypothetical protein